MNKLMTAIVLFLFSIFAHGQYVTDIYGDNNHSKTQGLLQQFSKELSELNKLREELHQEPSNLTKKQKLIDLNAALSQKIKKKRPLCLCRHGLFFLSGQFKPLCHY